MQDNKCDDEPIRKQLFLNYELLDRQLQINLDHHEKKVFELCNLKKKCIFYLLK